MTWHNNYFIYSRFILFQILAYHFHIITFFLSSIFLLFPSGEQRLNASFLGGSSDDGTNSDFYDPRQSPPKAIVDSSPLQPQMDKNKECK